MTVLGYSNISSSNVWSIFDVSAFMVKSICCTLSMSEWFWALWRILVALCAFRVDPRRKVFGWSCVACISSWNAGSSRNQPAFWMLFRTPKPCFSKMISNMLKTLSHPGHGKSLLRMFTSASTFWWTSRPAWVPVTLWYWTVGGMCVCVHTERCIATVKTNFSSVLDQIHREILCQ